MMKKQFVLLLAGLAVSLACATFLSAQTASGFVVLSEPGFPTADTAGLTIPQLQISLPGAHFASVQEIHSLLGAPETRLLVLPYGSAFPEEAWPDIYSYVARGGNLLVLGGRPFTRAAYRDASGWHLRDYSVRFTRPLMIDQYQTTSGSEGLQFQVNLDQPVRLPQFSWTHSFSPVIRLSAVDLYHRGGAAGSLDARLDTLAWGVKDGHKISAPVIQIDHWRNGFDGGRWIFVNAELAADFVQAANLIQSLAVTAMQGSQEFSVRPALPLYLPGEPIQIEVTWHAAWQSPARLALKITTYPEAQPLSRTSTTWTVPSSQKIALPPPNSKGLQIMEAELREGNILRATYRTGYWIRDEAFLRSGPRLAVNHDYFELDGQPLAVVGTTYMSSEVQRLYFEHPNVYVWNQDLSQIRAGGLNMIRSGWWTGWDKFCDENGQPYERTLRTMEAFLMTARKNSLPVQFNFFAFIPDVLGGMNPYFDPQAVRRQQTLVAAVVTRFKDVPWLAWDFINEPSISQHLWTMLPNRDAMELQEWNKWLDNRYPDRETLAALWNVPASVVQGTVPVPEDIEFSARGMYIGHNSLKVYDYFLFAQERFSNWVQGMRDTVRATGSQQLVTLGQDEGGIQDRLSPSYWGEFVDFTTNHSWWQNDYVLWDSLLAKQPGKAMLIQETGLQRELNLDEIARRTPENEAALLERKIASSFVQGTGAIEWLWNTNSYMTESNETPIGAVRTDGTEKPEATTLEAFAGFAKSLQGHLRNPERPGIAIVTSQAAQFSVIADLQLEAQRKAVRVLAYYDHLAPYGIAENQIDKLGNPKLAILPSPQTLTDKTWQALLEYVNDGGNLLITGPVERNEHWQIAPRVTGLKLDAHSEPLTYHNAVVQLGDRTAVLSFDQQKQNWLDSLRFSDGSTLKELSHGKGRIFWAAYPVELSNGEASTADLYSYVTGKLGITPAFELQTPVTPGVLIYATVLQDSVLYVMTSDSADDTKVDLEDKATGAHITMRLSGQHAALALIGKKEKNVIAKYGF